MSDAPVRQLAAEITREKLFLKLHQELPYQSTVETETWTERKDGSVRIEQTIYVERESQRKIVLGKEGRSIRSIGAASPQGAGRNPGEAGASFSVREGARALGRRSGALPGDGTGVSEGVGGWRRGRLLAVLLLVAGHAVAPAQPDRTQPPVSHHRIGYCERRRAHSRSAIRSPCSALCCATCRSVCTVYPTENYYYFRFDYKGVPYTGNIRLAAADRDKGKLHFAYGEAPTDRRPSPKVRHVVLDASQGVAVASLSANAYRVTHAGRSVTFALNDLAQVKPPRPVAARREVSRHDLRRIGGPVFSGVQCAAEDLPLSAR